MVAVAEPPRRRTLRGRALKGLHFPLLSFTNVVSWGHRGRLGWWTPDKHPQAIVSGFLL